MGSKQALFSLCLMLSSQQMWPKNGTVIASGIFRFLSKGFDKAYKYEQVISYKSLDVSDSFQ